MLNSNFKSVKNPLRVCHYPQIPCKPFIVEVKDELEAYKVSEVLSEQHEFLYDNNIISDYCDVIVVEMKVGDEWEDYYNEFENLDWEELVTTFEN